MKITKNSVKKTGCVVFYLYVAYEKYRVMNCSIYVTRPAKIDHVSIKNADFYRVCCIITYYLYYCNKIFITTAEFKGLSSATYGNGIAHSERKILAEI